MIRPGIRRLLRLVRSRGAVEHEVDDEIALHLELRVRQLRNQGLSPADARAEALRLFGPEAAERRHLYHLATAREHRMQRRERLAELATDLSYAARGLRREPIFALFVIATLALGVGVNAAMFGIADRLLVRGPDHVLRPQEVKRLYANLGDPDAPGYDASSSLGYAFYGALRHARSLSALAAYQIERDGIVMDRGEAAERVTLGQSTAGYFSLLGVTPAIGRFYTEAEDDARDPQHVVVIDHGLWLRKFGGRSDALGSVLRLGDVPYTVIGVSPRGFTGPELARVDVWVPLSIHSRNVTADWQTTWRAQWLRVVGRVAPGVTLEQANEEATRLIRAAAADRPRLAAAAYDWRPISSTDRGLEAPEAQVSRWLVGVALVVLLTACFNVTNLLIVRAMRRQREMAVRVALGSGRWRLMRLVLAEGLLLSVLAGGAALLMAMWSGHLVRGLLLPHVHWETSAVDLRVLGVTAVLVIVVALFTGVLPALQAVRSDLTASLQGGARGGGVSLHRTRRILTVAQAALSVMLLIGAGLFVRSLDRVRGEELGVDAKRTLVAEFRFVPLPDETGAAARSAAVYDRALDRVRELPGVANASLVVGLPFGASFGVTLRVPGWDSLPRGAYVSAVTPSYFESVGTRRLRGRTFGNEDGANSAPVAIVNRTMASTLWPGREAIGECLFIGEGSSTCSRVVGIVADARQNAIQELPTMHYYIPFGQERGFGGTNLIVRAAGDVTSLLPVLRRELLALDASVLYVDVEVMERFLDPEVRPWRLGASLFALMGLLALVVAGVGLYSVMSYFVAQRTPELGLRLALGASGGRVARMVLGGSLALATSGVAMGSALAWVGTRYLGDLLYRTSPRDPLVFGVAAGTLLLIATLAGVLPAWRARRVNPMVALRSE